ncbi:kinase-like domain-containing protein, partial [Amylostereum chailletii]
SDIDHLSDAEVLSLRENTLDFAPSPTPFGAYNIHRITENTVVKGAQDPEENIDYPSEALTLQLIAEQTNIPVPRVRRILKNRYKAHTAMEYIPGRQLSSVWPTLSFFQRVRVAFRLRSYARQLRAIRHPRSSVPGPVGQENDPARVCQSPPFGQVIETRGPFATYSDLSVFFNDRLARTLRSKHAKPGMKFGPFDDSQPLVLTHHDPNPRNVLVGDDGRLWLVDWAWSGFYPPWWEFVAMRRQAENEELKEPFWDAIIPLVCGPYFEQESWLDYGAACALDWL